MRTGTGCEDRERDGKKRKMAGKERERMGMDGMGKNGKGWKRMGRGEKEKELDGKERKEMGWEGKGWEGKERDGKERDGKEMESDGPSRRGKLDRTAGKRNVKE